MKNYSIKAPAPAKVRKQLPSHLTCGRVEKPKKGGGYKRKEGKKIDLDKTD